MKTLARCPVGCATGTGYKVHIAASTEREYEEAMAYLAQQSAFPRVLRSLADAFDAAVDALAENPYAYPIDTGMSKVAGREIRKIAAQRYLLRYSVDGAGREVRAYSMLHMRQDVRTRFPIDFAEGEWS